MGRSALAGGCRAGACGVGSVPEVDERPVLRPIEDVAAALRGLRRTMRVMSATPELIAPGDAEVVQVLVAYDRWLLEAARLSEVRVPVETAGPTLLRPERRHWLEHRLGELGWCLDG